MQVRERHARTRTGRGSEKEDDYQKICVITPSFPLSLQNATHAMVFEIDDMVLIMVGRTTRPGQIMDIKGSKYLVELYHDGDNSMSQTKYQYWRKERDIGLFTFDSWFANYTSCPKSAFIAYRMAGGYIPAFRMRPTSID